MVEYKICVKKHKYITYKISRECNSLNCLKNCQYNTCIYREEICQYVSKQYYTMYIRKKEKYRNCKDLSPKYITNNNNYYYYLKLLKLIYLFKMFMYYLSSFSSA